MACDPDMKSLFVKRDGNRKGEGRRLCCFAFRSLCPPMVVTNEGTSAATLRCIGASYIRHTCFASMENVADSHIIVQVLTNSACIDRFGCLRREAVMLEGDA